MSKAVERVVHKAMDPEPARRYATAHEFVEDLQRLQAGARVSARGLGAILRLRRWATYHPVAAITVLLLSLLLVVAGGFVLEKQATLRVLQASERTLASRTLERADPMRALAQALLADDERPSPTSLGQLNRLLHQVTMLSTATVLPGPVRRLAVQRLDDRHDLVAVAAEGGVSLLRLDRRRGALLWQRDLPVPATDLLRCVRFSPGGKYVAYGGMVKKAFVAVVDGQDIRTLAGADSEVFDVEVDDAGNVYGACVGGSVLYWSHDDAEPRLRSDFFERPQVPGADANIRGMSAGPGGDLLVWSADSAVRMRRDGSLVWIAKPVGRGSATPTAIFDTERQRVVLGQLGGIRTLNWEDGAVQWRTGARGAAADAAVRAPVTSCAVAADGTIASVHTDGVVRFADGGGTPFAEYRDPNDQMSVVLGAVTGNAFLAVGRGGTQVRLDSKGRVERGIYGGDFERLGVPGQYAWSTDGSVLVASAGPGQVRTWDFDGTHGAPAWRFVDSPPVGLSPHPDGRQLIVHTADHKTWLWQPGHPASLVDEVKCVFVARNGAMPGDRVAIGGRYERRPAFAIFEVERGRFGAPISLPIRAAGIIGLSTLAGDRLLLATGDSRAVASRLFLCDLERAGGTFDEMCVGDWALPDGVDRRLTCMDASADGHRVVIGDVAGALHVLSLPGDGKPPATLKSAQASGRIWSVDISADGRFAVAGLEDGEVLTWRIDDGVPEQLESPRGRGARAFLGDNDHLVIEFAPDGIVRLWDARLQPAAVVFEVVAGDGAVVRDAVLMGLEPGIGLAAMRLATVSSDGWLRLWSLHHAAVVDLARARLEALGGTHGR